MTSKVLNCVHYFTEMAASSQIRNQNSLSNSIVENKANYSTSINTTDFNGSHVISQTMHQTCNYRSVEWLVNEYSKSLGQSFNLIHCNIRSLSKNKYKIEELLQSAKTKPDVLAISESKLNNNNLRRASLIDYSMVNCDSISNAGGVALYVSNSLEFCKLEEYSIASRYFETLFIEVKLKSVIYRHPSTSLSEF